MGKTDNKAKHNHAMQKYIALDGLYYVSAAYVGDVISFFRD